MNGSPALTGARHPLYRLHTSDVLEIKFTFSPEFDQSATVLPDGFLSLKTGGEIFAEGLTISELRDLVRDAYTPTLRDPEVSVMLKDFERPFFVAGGQVGHPGKYELRSRTTVAEAVAIAGGFTEQSKHSQVVVFRKINDGVVEAHVLNVKSMLAWRNLEEDLQLQPGDMLFVPQNRISKPATKSWERSSRRWATKSLLIAELISRQTLRPTVASALCACQPIRTKHLETLIHTLLSTIHGCFSSCDVVQYYTLGPSLFSFLPRLFGKKTVVTVQGLDWQRKKWGWIARRALKFCEWTSARLPNATAVVSHTLEDYYREHYAKECAYVPNGTRILECHGGDFLQSHGLGPGG